LVSIVNVAGGYRKGNQVPVFHCFAQFSTCTEAVIP